MYSNNIILGLFYYHRLHSVCKCHPDPAGFPISYPGLLLLFTGLILAGLLLLAGLLFTGLILDGLLGLFLLLLGLLLLAGLLFTGLILAGLLGLLLAGLLTTGFHVHALCLPTRELSHMKPLFPRFTCPQ